MTEASKLREQIVLFAKSIFDRGLTSGSSGNISARLSDGTILMTPTGSSMGFLDPTQISHLAADMTLLAGDPPTKEHTLHTAFYDTRPEACAVVHLHSSYSVALSMMPDLDPDDVLPALTPYPIMRLGRVKLLPFFLPGDPAMGEALRALGGSHSAVLLANHGPVVADRALDAAVYAMEEFEEAAKLAMMTSGTERIGLTAEQVSALRQKFPT